MTITKTQELSEKFRLLDEDMVKYLSEYLLPALSNTDFESENLYMTFDSMSDNPYDKQVASIDKDGVVFVYCCKRKCKKFNVSLEELRMDDLFKLIQVFEPYL